LPKSYGSTNTDNDIYYKLHQATGFYEQYLSGHCSIGKKEALNFLNSLPNQKINLELSVKISGLKDKLKGEKKPSTYDLESFRLSIHEMQNNLSFIHQKKWHDDIVAECKAHNG